MIFGNLVWGNLFYLKNTFFWWMSEIASWMTLPVTSFHLFCISFYFWLVYKEKSKLFKPTLKKKKKSSYKSVCPSPGDLSVGGKSKSKIFGGNLNIFICKKMLQKEKSSYVISLQSSHFTRICLCTQKLTCRRLWTRLSSDNKRQKSPTDVLPCSPPKSRSCVCLRTTTVRTQKLKRFV